MAVTEEPTPLGEPVERALLELIAAGNTHGPMDRLSIDNCGPCQEALSHARNSIRERMAEPKPEPPPEFIQPDSFVDRNDIHHRLGEPLIRTSKHSGSKQHELSAVVYTMLGTNDPAQVAKWIGDARRSVANLTDALVAERSRLP